MPRIPVRIEPYTSPSRQHRHYKNKRDQVLRALGKAAYINGSHFSIMWVSARGDVETYASEALQDRLEDWFVKSGIADEAKRLVIGAQGMPRTDPFQGDDLQEEEGGEDGDGYFSEDDRGLTLQVPGSSTISQPSSSFTTPVMPSDDVFTDVNPSINMQENQTRLDSRPTLHRSSSTSAGKRKTISPLDTSVVNEQYLKVKQGADLHPQSAVEGHYMSSLKGLGLNTSDEKDFIVPPHSAPLRMAAPPNRNTLQRTNSSTQQHVPQFETRLDNLKARTTFLELRFSQLQQGMCKTVAKAWIKIIEPKKQTRCPYNKGEEGKPKWWPEGVRHKEPDHLMKPERHALLLTILRSPDIQVARLQLATAEVVALIKADKVSLLMDVYRIAREEEKMREAGIDLDTPMKVGVSTLDGWSEIDQSVTADRAGSPLDDEVEVSTKRKAVGMGRSASASSTMKSNKRRASALDFSSSSSSSSSPLLTKADNGLDNARRPLGNWMMQEATQNSMKKAMNNSSMAAPNTVNASYGQANAQQQQVMGQNYGLITPLTGNSHLMDPHFLQATKDTSGDGFVAGYMSAPPPSHAQLYPHSTFQFQGSQHQQQQQQQHHQYNLHTTRDASNLFAYQQQQQRLEANAIDGTPSTSSSALGLQGIGMHWSNAGFGQDFSNDSNAAASAWWQQQQQQQRPQPPPQSKDAPIGLGDSSFETSFASTVDSAGPATPPMSVGTIQRSSDSKEGSGAGPAGVGTLDYVQHLQFQPQASSQQQQQQQQPQPPQQINRNPYNLSLGKVSNTYDSWSFQAQKQ
ncbi:hypothetical protein CBS101457_000386 [Exobasidium rhododendri]|nr:hypothetical protein CBS101457_000386 [Exobasidium rhododendri]